MIDSLVEAAASWGAAVESVADSEVEKERYTVLCFARKWLSEHVELLCEEAGVEPSETDVFVRYT